MVVEQFQTTSHTPEALHRLVESYLSLGLVDEAQRPQLPFDRVYEDSYALLTGQGLKTRGQGQQLAGRDLQAGYSPRMALIQGQGARGPCLGVSTSGTC